MTTTYTGFATFSQDTLDTIVKTNAAAAKGFETVTKYFADLAGKSFEDAVIAGNQLSGAKTVVEFMQIQSKLAQVSMKVALEESKKISELATSIAKDVSSPITDRFKGGVAVAKKAAKKAA